MASWEPGWRHLSATRRQRRHVPHSERPAEFVRQRNERERRRVDTVNEAFIKLSSHLPPGTLDNWDMGGGKDAGRGVSKINTLRAAIDYIGDLQKVLQDTETGPTRGQTPDVPGNHLRQDCSRALGMLMYGSASYRSPGTMPSGCTQSRFVYDSDQFCNLEQTTFVTGLAPEQLHSGTVYNTLCYVQTPANVYAHLE